MSKVNVPLKLIKMFDEILIIQKCQSKKNQAFEIQADGQKYILKIFSDQRKQYLQTEVSVLSCAKQDLVPSLIAYDEQNSFLMLEKIPGNNLCDVLNDVSLDSKQKEKFVILLANWFATFHKHFSSTSCTTLVRGDTILRNFILSKNKIIGVDFEEAKQANPWEDIGEICASILDTTPMFTKEKFKLVNVFLKKYSDSVPVNCKKKYSTMISESLFKHQKFREEENANQLKHWAKKIEESKILEKNDFFQEFLTI